MRHAYDRFDFPSPKGVPNGHRASQIVSRFAGMPVGAELADRWMYHVYDLSRPRDQEAFVDSPGAPGEGNAGTEWQGTQLTSSTVTIVDTGFPAYLRILTGATDGHGQQFQACVGAGGNTRTLFDTSTMEDLYFSITCRLSDANNNAATLEQSRLFAGFAPVDTSVLAGVDDYIGFAKADGSDVVKLVADQTSGVPVTGASTSDNLFQLGTSGNAAQSLVNEWFTMSFLGQGLDRTAQEGTVYAFLDWHRRLNNSTKHAPTFVGSINLDTNSDVPGAAMCPTIAFNAGEATAKRLDISKVIVAGKYRLGV